MKTNAFTNGPAFPVPEEVQGLGITKIEYIAAMALQAHLTTESRREPTPEQAGAVAITAVNYAEALMLELEKRGFTE